MADYNPGRIESYRRLKHSVEWSLSRKKKRNEQRMKLLKKLVGPKFGEDGCKENRPVNMIELGTDIFQRGLASHSPQALVTSDHEELWPAAADFEAVLNKKIRTIHLQSSLNVCAMDALFTMGTMCVGWAIDNAEEAGHVFAEPVLFPDLILDMNAKSWEQQTYVGHDFLVPMDWVRNSPLFEGKGKDTFLRAQDRRLNDEDWEQTRREDFLDMVVLRQLYLPLTNEILICDPDGGTLPLMLHEWEGPHTHGMGPYHSLRFRIVPGHLFPLAPVPMWEDLDEVMNKSFSRAARQALRAKKIGLARSREDAEAINKTMDGEVVDVSDPQAIIEQVYGGADQGLLGIMQISKMLLTYLGGNWDGLGGLAAQSGTVGQDKLLSEAASGRMKDMQQTMGEFQDCVINDIAFWLWNDPMSDESFTKKLEGTSVEIPGRWTQESKQGEFFQYNFRVNPYAAVKRSPTEQAEMLIQLLTTVVLPSLPYMQQGAPVDWEFFFKLLAKFMHAPELNQIIRWPQGDAYQTEEGPKMPPQTTRTYERVNRPGASRSGTDAALAQLMMGGQPQQAEMAALMQPVT